MSSVVKLMIFFQQQSMGIIKSGIGGMTSILRMSTLSFYTTKPFLIQSKFGLFLIKCGILLNISL